MPLIGTNPEVMIVIKIILLLEPSLVIMKLININYLKAFLASAACFVSEDPLEFQLEKCIAAPISI